MKKVSIIVLVVFLCSLVFGLFGCTFEQQGETVAEGHRRHIRNMRLARQQLMEDIDAALLLDQPSRLSDKVVP